MKNKPTLLSIPLSRLTLLTSLGLSLLAPLCAHADRQDQAIECNFKGCTSDEVVVVAPITGSGDPGSIVAPPNTPPTPNPTPNPSGNHGSTHAGAGGGGGIKGDNSNPSPVTAVNPHPQPTAAQQQAAQVEKDRAECSHILVRLAHGPNQCYPNPSPTTHCDKTTFTVGHQPVSSGCGSTNATVPWVTGSGCSSWTFTSNTCALDLSSTSK